MASEYKSVSSKILEHKDLIFEFALNRFRLNDGFLFKDFENMTGLSFDVLNPSLDKAISKGLITVDNNKVDKTQRGRDFVNDLIELFLD
jgi:coproporphyrinogen III oxidase-like Fe-S oxidoreductase